METFHTTTMGRTWTGELWTTPSGSVLGAGYPCNRIDGMPRPQEQWGAASLPSWQRNDGGYWVGVGTPRDPLFFSHDVLTKTLVIRREKEILASITRRMDLW